MLSAEEVRSSPAETARRRRFVVLGICSMSLVIVNIDSTALNVALPSIQRDFHASLSNLQWVTDAYVLVMSVLMLASGSMGDRVGRRTVFRTGFVIFVLGSLACSLAPSIGMLIAFRMIQAVGGSMLNPNALSIITHTFADRRERAKAIGLWSATYGIALATGPIVGGLLVDSLGWRWVFWINVPIGIAALVLISLFVPDSKAATARRVDVAGQLLVIGALGSLTYAIIEGPSLGWTSAAIDTLFALAAVALVAFVAVERRVSDPLVEVRFFRSPPFSAAGVAATLCFFIMGGFLFVNTLYLQDVRGESALIAGVGLLPATLFIGLLSPVAGHLVGHYGPRVPLVVGGLTSAAGTAVLAFVFAGSSYGFLILAYSLIGIGMGFVNPPITNTAVSGMPVSQAGVAGAIAAASRQVGTVLGIALLGSLLAQNFASALPSRLSRLHLGHQELHALVAAGAGAPALARRLTGARTSAVAESVRSTFASAMHTGWWLCSAAGVVLAVVAFLSAGPKGQAVAGRVLSGIEE